MNVSSTIFGELGLQEISTAGTHTLLHLSWLTILVGCILWLALRVIPSRSANLRYWMACLAFFALPVVAVCIFASKLDSETRPITVASIPLQTIKTAMRKTSVGVEANLIEPHGDARKSTSVDQSPLIPFSDNANRIAVSPSTSRFRTGSSSSEFKDGNAFLPLSELASDSRTTVRPSYSILIFAAYAIGVMSMIMRLFWSIVFVHQIRRAASPTVDSELVAMIQRLAQRIKLRSRPGLMFCEKVVVPTVIGIIKPIILFPPAILCSLSNEDLEAILLHEMAHIKRWDLVVNLFQRGVEVLFFFHPIAWWISRQINTERENCCDDLAADKSLNQIQYANALVRMAEICVAGRGVKLTGLAIDGNKSSELTRRIERQLGLNRDLRLGVFHASILLTVSLTAVSIFGFSGGLPESLSEDNSTQTIPNQSPEPVFGRADRKTAPTQELDETKPTVNRASEKQKADAKSELDVDEQWTDREHKHTLKLVREILSEPYRPNLVIGSMQLESFEARMMLHISSLPKGLVVPAVATLLETEQLDSIPGKNVAHQFLLDNDKPRLANLLVKRLPNKSPVKNPNHPDLFDIGTLGQLGPYAAKAVPHLSTILRSAVAETRIETLIALAKIEPDSATTIKLIAQACEDANPRVRSKALYVLARFGELAKSHREYFENNLNYDHSDVRVWAAFGLAATEADVNKGLAVLFHLAQSKDAKESKKALTALSALGSSAKSLIPDLNKRLKSLDEPRQKGFAKAIERIKSNDRIPTHLQECFKRHPELNVQDSNAPDDETSDLQKNTGDPSKLNDPDSIFWGKEEDGIQLGFRILHERGDTVTVHHGELFEYEVFIQNNRKEVIHVVNDPSLYTTVRFRKNALNLVGLQHYLSFELPREAFLNAIVSIDPGQSRQATIGLSRATMIDHPDAKTKPGHYAPLRLPAGTYPISASGQFSIQIGGKKSLGRKDTKYIRLESAKAKIKIVPRSRLQLRRMQRIRKEDEVARPDDFPGRQEYLFTDSNGIETKYMLNKNHGVLANDDDILGAEFCSPKLVIWSLSDGSISRIKSATELMLKKTHLKHLGVFLDGKLISVAKYTQPIDGRRAFIPCDFSTVNRELLTKYLLGHHYKYPCQTAWSGRVDGYQVGARLEGDNVGGHLRIRYFLKMDEEAKPVTFNMDGVQLKTSDLMNIGSQIVVPLKEKKRPGQYIAIPSLKKKGNEYFVGATVSMKSDDTIETVKKLISPKPSFRIKQEKTQSKAKLKFLQAYPKMHQLSLELTRKQFLEWVKAEKIEAWHKDEKTYYIDTDDGFTVIVMFLDRNPAQCTGIQRVPGPIGEYDKQFQKVKIDVGTRALPMSPKAAIGFIGERWVKDSSDPSVKNRMVSPMDVTVSFEVADFYIPIGSQPKGTDLPIGLIANKNDDNVQFSVLLSGSIPTTLKRLGLRIDRKEFVGRNVEVTGKILKFPMPVLNRENVQRKFSYAIWIDSIESIVLHPKAKNAIPVLQPKSYAKLDLDGKKVTAENLKTQLSGKSFERVSLRNATFDGEIISLLSSAKSIQKLKLSEVRLTGHISRLQKVNGLTQLELHTPLLVRDLKSISEFQKLHRLVLPKDLALTVTGAKQIAKLTQLKELNLYGVDVDDASFKELRTLEQLESLDLSHTRVTDDGLKTLEHMKQLATLELTRYDGDEQISDDCIDSLSKLNKLSRLSLSGEISDKGLKRIAQFPELKSLSILNTKVTSKGLNGLAGSKIEHLTLSAELIRHNQLFLKSCPSIKHLSVHGQRNFNEHHFMDLVPSVDWSN